MDIFKTWFSSPVAFTFYKNGRRFIDNSNGIVAMHLRTPTLILQDILRKTTNWKKKWLKNTKREFFLFSRYKTIPRLVLLHEFSQSAINILFLQRYLYHKWFKHWEICLGKYTNYVLHLETELV